MSDHIKLTKKITTKHLETRLSNYKTMLNSKDLSQSKSFYKENKHPTSVDKRTSEIGLVGLEKKVSNISDVHQNSRSSSAVKNKKMSSSSIVKKSPTLKCKNLLTPTTDLINKLLYKNKDERYRYLIKNSVVHYIEKHSETIYVELPQIPNILIVYRKPDVRVTADGQLSLDERGLSHVPLLEGEEKLVKFIVKRNKVSKLENLVSLPNLEYLDVSYNCIREITNLNSLEKLKTLNLRSNLIDCIFGLGLLQSLEHIDLSMNKIKKVERLEKCIRLKSLNLSNNFITAFEGLSNLSSLEHVNLSNNKIIQIKDTRGLILIQNLNLGNNLIDSGLEKIKNLEKVTHFNIENNPICRKSDFFRTVKKMMPNLAMLNGRKAILPNEFSFLNKKDSTMSNAPVGGADKEINNVIKIIQKEWAREIDRLSQNYKGLEDGAAKKAGERCCVQSGHAEIESNKMLFIYGNAMEVLKRVEFYNVVEEIHLECVRFDHIVHYTHLDKIRKFVNIKKLHLSYNNLSSLILLSKLECLQNLESLIIENNDILKCDLLKDFIVYRFQHLIYYNSTKITDEDRKSAKQNFSLFDNILSKSLRRYAFP